MQTSILHGKNLEERTALLKMYIKLAANLKEHNNFNGIMMIQAALESAGVHRLKKTWENLSKDKQKLFEDTVSTMSHVKNFGNYRALLQKCQPPSLPYVGTPNEAVVFLPSNPPFYFFFQSGLYMTDLTFMCDGNDDNISKKNSTVKQINVDKRRMLSKSTCLKKKNFFLLTQCFVATAEIKQFQATKYTFEPKADLQSLILLAHGTSLQYTEQQLYQLSLQVEPRAKSTTSVTM